jgi:hypothetical protein
VGGGAEIFKLLGGEDVNGDQMDLGVTVLSGLGGGHLDNLAGTVLNDDETVLPQSRTLHGVGLGGTGIGALEGVLMLGRRECQYMPDGYAQKVDVKPGGATGDAKSIRWGKCMCGVSSGVRTCASSAMVMS